MNVTSPRSAVTVRTSMGTFVESVWTIGISPHFSRVTRKKRELRVANDKRRWMTSNTVYLLRLARTAVSMKRKIFTRNS